MFGDMDVVMSRWCASRWSFLFKHLNAFILQVKTSPSSFHGVFAEGKWNISVYNISDDTDFDICE